jgi:LPS-assembly lipoprotein
MIATRRGLAAAVVVGTGGLLAGCGFRPMYGRDPATAPVSADLAAIEVGLIPERPGQLLRLALQRKLDPLGAQPPAGYDLDIVYSVTGEGIAIGRDDAAARLRLVATATWVLRRRGGGREEVARGVTRAVDGFNIASDQPFASEASGDAAQRRLAEQVADQMVMRLGTLLTPSG